MPASVSPRWDLATAITDCNFANEQEVVSLMANQYTAVYFEEAAINKLYRDPREFGRSVLNMYPTMNFDYGQGALPRNRVYHPPYLPTGRQNFQNDALPQNDWVAEDGASPGNSNCVFCYQEIPFGGYSTQEAKIVRRDYRTPQVCARDVASSSGYLEYADMITQSRVVAEQTAMYDFRNWIMLETSAHKILLESGSPFAAQNPAQAVQALYPESFNDPNGLFPQITDPEAIQPLSYQFLQLIYNYIGWDYQFERLAADGQRGSIFELYVDNDWYYNEVLNNPQWTETMRYREPMALFFGQNPDSRLYPSGQAEVLGNWRFVIDSTLPRYALTVDNGIVEVQKYTTITTENGVEAVLNRDWLNAPFGVAFLKNRFAAELLSQPAITTNQGIAIPDVQRTNWLPWNEYDPLCNPEKLKPFWKFHFRMGYMPREPWMGIAVLYRRELIETPGRPACSLQPLNCVTPVTNDCDDLNGPCGNRESLQASITRTVQGTDVIWDHTECGGDQYVTVQTRFQTGQADNVISCDCGGSVLVTYSDGTSQLATLLNTRYASSYFPFNQYFLDLGDGNSVPVDECITLIQCVDETPATADILACQGSDECEELDADQVIIYLAQPLVCGVTETDITITAANGSTTFNPVTIVSSNESGTRIVVEATGLVCLPTGTSLSGGTIVCAVP